MMSDTKPTAEVPTPPGTETIAPTSPEAVVVDPWAVVDEAAPVVPSEENVLPERTEKAEAISKLRESTSKLGSALSSNTAALGHKLRIPEAWSALGSSIRKVDESTKATETCKSAGSSFGSWLSTNLSAIDQKFHVSTKSKELGSNISAAINEVVPPEMIDNAIKNTSKGLSEFDDAHGITKATAKTLASGADLLTGSLPSPGSSNGNTGPDDTLALDEDGLPTSFTSKPSQ